MKNSSGDRLWRMIRVLRAADHIGVFIDCDGVSAKNADVAVQHAKQHGDIRVIRVYGNYSGRAAAAWAGFIRERGAMARHLPNLTPRKNASDIALTIDVMDVLLTGRSTPSCLSSTTLILCLSRSASGRPASV